MSNKTDAELRAEANVIKNETSSNQNTTNRVGSHLTNLIDSKATKEFNRAFSEELIFDQNEIFHFPITMTGDLNLTIGPGGLVDQASAMRLRFTADGVSAINFGAGFDFLYGITNGQILDAGLYEIYFLYTNGSVSVNLPGVTQGQSSAITLASPSNFTATADGENDIDLSWDDVANESSYLIEVSLDGLTGWTTLATPAADAITSAQSGLIAGDTRYYRIKSIGDGVNFVSSGFSSVVSAQTENAGDVTDPTFTFLPAAGNNTWTVNEPITITADEPIRNTNGSTLTDANIAAVLILKQTNSGGADIAFTATIDSTKTIITITPTSSYGATQLVYVAINNVEDVNGNEVTVAISSTFTTTAFTFFNGTSNFMSFGDILDSLWTANDTYFKLRVTVQNTPLSGNRFLHGKYSASDNKRTYYWRTDGDDVVLTYTFAATSADRVIRWSNVLTAGLHMLEMIYDGSIDTNNGRDRGILKIDAVDQGAGTLELAVHSLGSLANTGAHFAFGAGLNESGAVSVAFYFSGQAKDFEVLSAGDVSEIDIPNMKSGIDVSGNARHSTWGL